MTHLCINCNAPAVHRAGDRFTCKKCGYRWDVAHEQANAAYLASQGRQPAESSVPAMKGAGQIPASGEPTTEDRLVGALVKYTVADIDELAGAAGVDLGDARLKHEKAATLIRSGKIALDEAGAVVVVDEGDSEDGEKGEGEPATDEGESE